MAKKITLTIKESLEELRRLFHTHPHHLHPRIQMLYLIKSGITDSTKVLSSHLFMGTRIIQLWKRLYEKSSLKGLLTYQRGKKKNNGLLPPPYTQPSRSSCLPQPRHLPVTRPFTRMGEGELSEPPCQG